MGRIGASDSGMSRAVSNLSAIKLHSVSETKPVIWLTGISGSGKSTIANLLHEEFTKLGVSSVILDGDIVRKFFEGDLGYTRAERIMNVRRIAFAAKMLAECGTTVIVANIAPYYGVRQFIRAKTPNYVQVYVKASLDEVIRRDVQGHYAKYLAGEMTNIIGADEPYDVPRSPDIELDTEIETPDISCRRILDWLIKSGKIVSQEEEFAHV